jgi:hypothetical protein
MRSSFSRAVAAVVVAAALASCAGGPAGLFTKTQERIGDQVCGADHAAIGIAGRVACAAAAAVIVAELSADRVALYQPDRAGEAVEVVRQMRRAFDRLHDGANADWFYAELFDIERVAFRAGERVLRNEIRQIEIGSTAAGVAAGVIAGGPAAPAAVAAVAASALPRAVELWDGPGRLAVGYAGKAAGMVADVQSMIARLNAGDLTIDEVFFRLNARLQESESRVESLLASR